MGWFLQAVGLQQRNTVAESDVPAIEPGELATAVFRNEKLEEAVGSLQLALEDQGWAKLTNELESEFSRDGLAKAANLCRLNALANPLVKNGLEIRAAYVHGQGVGITARSDGTEGTQDVNTVIQDFLDDDDNRATLTGHQAKLRLEKALGTDGNVFIVLFTDPLDGTVQPRTIPFAEIVEKQTKPGDSATAWYYRRAWTEGKTKKEELYPDLRYRPLTRPKTVDGLPVNWDSPIYHLHDNGLDGWTFGIGDAYAALPYARAYKEFIEDWVLLVRALSKIAFRASTKKTPVSQQARSKLNQMAELPAGSTVAMSTDQTLEAVPKSGATIDSESGRPVMALVAAALGLPVTMLGGDPGTTGNRATAETLDFPTRLRMQGRQELWTEALRAILGYVIDQAVIAPRGPLKGTTTRRGDRLHVALRGDDDRTLEIVWPSLDNLPMTVLMEAIEKAEGTGTIPPLVIAQLTLRALGVRDVDEILEEMTDANGDFIPPDVTAGDVAAQNFRNGNDPAAPLQADPEEPTP